MAICSSCNWAALTAIDGGKEEDSGSSSQISPSMGMVGIVHVVPQPRGVGGALDLSFAGIPGGKQAAHVISYIEVRAVFEAHLLGRLDDPAGGADGVGAILYGYLGGACRDAGSGGVWDCAARAASALMTPGLEEGGPELAAHADMLLYHGCALSIILVKGGSRLIEFPRAADKVLAPTMALVVPVLEKGRAWWAASPSSTTFFL